MPIRPLFLTALLLGSGLTNAQADSYTLPADLTSSPFNCTLLNSGAYDCPAISLSKDTTLSLTGSVNMTVNGKFDANKTFSTDNHGYTFALTVMDDVDFRMDLTAQMNLTVTGKVNFAKDAHFTGNIITKSSSGDLTVAKDSWIDGNVNVAGDLKMGNDSYITGTCIVTGSSNYSSCVAPPPPPSTLHHVRLNHTGSGLTCTPAQVTVYACSDADSGGSCTANTSGISGTVVAMYSGGSAPVPFTIAAGASSVTVDVGVTVPGNATLSTSALSPALANASTCWNAASGSRQLRSQLCRLGLRLRHPGSLFG
ncbi:polymer-forming cytoskeletal protein [Pseudoduganella sp. UC29_106]|uniref:polymer-forming cytoskeletal protein n=1 Tax=Pseudoduganella sp. UC29_106 TaxID=3374553 RepID=UPI0037571198